MTAPLPRGQRAVATFPRFGLTHFARRFPSQTSRAELEIIGHVEHRLNLPDALSGLPRVEQFSDFHCATTGSRQSLCWGGVRFKDFYETVILPQARPHPQAGLVELRGQDGARTGMLLTDLLAPEVLLADTLDGAPLTIEHGAPLRLLAPAHYGYKSVKYLSRLDFKPDGTDYRVSAFRFMDHPRARVAQEERGRGAPGWLLRYLYRPMISPVVALFSNTLAAHHNARSHK